MTRKNIIALCRLARKHALKGDRNCYRFEAQGSRRVEGEEYFQASGLQHPKDENWAGDFTDWSDAIKLVQVGEQFDCYVTEYRFGEALDLVCNYQFKLNEDSIQVKTVGSAWSEELSL